MQTRMKARAIAGELYQMQRLAYTPDDLALVLVRHRHRRRLGGNATLLPAPERGAAHDEPAPPRPGGRGN